MFRSGVSHRLSLCSGSGVSHRFSMFRSGVSQILYVQVWCSHRFSVSGLVSLIDSQCSGLVSLIDSLCSGLGRLIDFYVQVWRLS